MEGTAFALSLGTLVQMRLPVLPCAQRTAAENGWLARFTDQVCYPRTPPTHTPPCAVWAGQGAESAGSGVAGAGGSL